jgi:deoxyribodipyrimidine photolyase-related protein
MKELRLILGDQLNPSHSWFREVNSEVVYVLAELWGEATYAKHHAQKILGFFAAMRRFAEFLKRQGHSVHYVRISEPESRLTFTELLEKLSRHYGATTLSYLLPDEYRLDKELGKLKESTSISVCVVDSEHFLTERGYLASQFGGKKRYLMETFYRGLRKRYKVLMDSGGEPLGGRWNFDSENRKAWNGKPALPEPYHLHHDLSELWEEIQSAGIPSVGLASEGDFCWPLDYSESKAVLEDFIQRLLPHFGDYQDAMVRNAWSLWHSRLSFSMNLKMLHPLEVIRAVEAAYIQNPGRYSLSGVEGFIRQILGWREYMRGIYWAEMPNYATLNFLNQERSLPGWYWTGETKMECLSLAIRQTLEHAYAHHIQRLMVTGAFGVLAGIHPDEMDEWYLGVYIDAIEWVEITNTRGMSQFADGGIVGTKPYVASANYMNKMSDSCKKCFYNAKERLGDKACPWNSLYWNFHMEKEAELSRNPRIGMVYRTLDKMPDEEKEAIRAKATSLLRDIERL